MTDSPGGVPVRGWERWALAGLLLATVLAYLPAIDGARVLDDLRWLMHPTVVAPLEASPEAWGEVARPLLQATFALDHALFGLVPRGWHLGNVAVHLCAVLLAWWLARRLHARAGLAEPRLGALAAAALFALHPLQTESVAYVIQRGESLASAFYLAALIALLARDEESPARRRGWLLAAAAVLQLLGLLTKPIVATLPLAWLLAAAVLPVAAEARAPAWRRVADRLQAAAPLFLLSAGAALRTLLEVKGSTHAGFDIPGLSSAQYLATQLRVIPAYLGLLAWPSGQSADWTVEPSRGFLQPAVLGGGLLLAGLVAGSFWLRRALDAGGSPYAPAGRLAAFGVPFFLVVLLPSSSVIPLQDLMVEHRVYLPILGLLLPIGAVLDVAAGPGSPAARRAVVGVVALAVVAALGLATARRSAVWSGPLALFGDAARRPAVKARVHANLGLALLATGRDAEALERFRAALARTDDRTVSRARVLHDLVVTLVGMGRTEEALAATGSVRLPPEETPVAEALHGYVHFRRGEREEGLAEIRRALALAPGEPRILSLLSAVEFVMGRPAEAAAAARAALAVSRDERMALRNLGLASVQLGDLATARAALTGAAMLGSGDAPLLVQLAGVEARLGDVGEACRRLGEALALPDGGFAVPLARAERARLRCR